MTLSDLGACNDRKLRPVAQCGRDETPDGAARPGDSDHKERESQANKYSIIYWQGRDAPFLRSAGIKAFRVLSARDGVQETSKKTASTTGSPGSLRRPCVLRDVHRDSNQRVFASRSRRKPAVISRGYGPSHPFLNRSSALIDRTWHARSIADQLTRARSQQLIVDKRISFIGSSRF